MVNLSKIITAIVPGGDIANTFIEEWKNKKIKEAQEIFLMELREGVFDNIDVDETISISHRLWRSISEGTAKNNLRLLCRLVQGLSDKNVLTVSSFSKFANIIENLTDNEIKIIAKDIWLYNNPEPKKIRRENFFNKDLEYNEALTLYNKALEKYNNDLKNWKNSFFIFAKNIGLSNPLPKNYFTEEYYPLLRTGLYGLDIRINSSGSLNPIEDEYGSDPSNVDIEAETEFIVYFTDLFIELQKYVNFIINVS